MIRVQVRDALTGALITEVSCTGSARVEKADLELDYPIEQGYIVEQLGSEDDDSI